MLIVTCYDNEFVKSGWLALTKTEFIFFDLEKKSCFIKIKFDEVNTIEYGSVLRRIKGMIVVKVDDTKVGFALALQDFENIKKILAL